jgi:hypothetical protein
MPTKEVIPAKTPVQNSPKPVPQKIGYESAGKETLTESIKKSVPRQLIPTKRMGTIFGGIFIIVLIISAFQFPYSNLMSGNTDVAINIGYPLVFVELGITETDEMPIKVVNLILSIILYLVLAYGIDIALNLILTNPLLRPESDAKRKPITFKNRKPSIVEKTASKVAEKVVKEISKENPEK